MAINIININDYSDRIIHETAVDVGDARKVVSSIHIVQYDSNLPIIAVKLYKNGNPYTIPNTFTDIKVRWRSPNYHFIIADILGCNSDKNIVYFEVKPEMTTKFGNIMCNLQVTKEVNNETYIGGSASMPIIIEQNPVLENVMRDNICSNIKQMILQLTHVEGPVNELPGYDDLMNTIHNILE